MIKNKIILIFLLFFKPALFIFKELSIVRGFYSEGICRICLCNPLNQDLVHHVLFFRWSRRCLVFCTISGYFRFLRGTLYLDSSFQCQILLTRASRFLKHWRLWEHLIQYLFTQLNFIHLVDSPTASCIDSQILRFP